MSLIVRRTGSPSTLVLHVHSHVVGVDSLIDQRADRVVLEEVADRQMSHRFGETQLEPSIPTVAHTAEDETDISVVEDRHGRP